MNLKMVHMNINVLDLEKSLAFYQKSLNLTEVRRKEASDGSFTLVYLTDQTHNFQLELTHLTDRTTPYDLSDNEIHLAFSTDDFSSTKKLHQEQGVICMENEKMGIYFIEDPDGYWIEIVPEKK